RIGVKIFYYVTLINKQKRTKCSKGNGKYRNWRYLALKKIIQFFNSVVILLTSELPLSISSKLIETNFWYCHTYWRNQSYRNKSKKGRIAIYGIELSLDDIKKIDPKPFNK
ncbi:hypothetical protein RFI_36522, partial [Reticulomyxa filosa]